MTIVALKVVKDTIRNRKRNSQLTCPHCGQLFGLKAVREGKRRGYEECQKEYLETPHPEFQNLGENTSIDINIHSNLRILCSSCGKMSKFSESLEYEKET